MFMGRCQAWMYSRPDKPAIVSRAHELQHMLSFLEVGALVVHDDSIAR